MRHAPSRIEYSEWTWRWTKSAWAIAEGPCYARPRRAPCSAQNSPRTSFIDSSKLRISCAGRCPTASPRESLSTVRSCSTRSTVLRPRIVILGRNRVGVACVEVGATITVERPASSDACRTTANLRPCPRVSRGAGSATTSPRWSKLIHRIADLSHEPPVSGIASDKVRLGANLFEDRGSSRVDERLSNCLGLRQATSHELVERALSLCVEPNRDRPVSHFEQASSGVEASREPRNSIRHHPQHESATAPSR